MRTMTKNTTERNLSLVAGTQAGWSSLVGSRDFSLDCVMGLGQERGYEKSIQAPATTHNPAGGPFR